MNSNLTTLGSSIGPNLSPSSVDGLLSLLQNLHEQLDEDDEMTESKLKMHNLVEDITAILVRRESGVAKINKELQESIFKEFGSPECLPNFITDESFFDFMCSNKIYNRVKFKEALFAYSGEKDPTVRKNIKKKDEYQYFARCIIFYGTLESSLLSKQSDALTYDLSLEYRFLQFGLNSLGVNCPNKFNSLIAMCEGIDDSLCPHTEQLVNFIRLDKNMDSKLQSVALSVDYVFTFLLNNQPEDLSIDQKNGVIAYMSAFQALFNTDLHYLYAVGMKHHWMYEHCNYYHMRYVKECITESARDNDIDNLITCAFNEKGLLFDHLIHSGGLVSAILSRMTTGFSKLTNLKLMTFMVINSASIIPDIAKICTSYSIIKKINNAKVGEQLKQGLDVLSEGISNILACELTDDKNRDIVNNIMKIFPQLTGIIEDIPDKNGVVDVLNTSFQPHFKFMEKDIVEVDEKVMNLKNEVTECMGNLDTSGMKLAIEEIEILKQRFTSSVEACDTSVTELFSKLKDMRVIEEDVKATGLHIDENELTELHNQLKGAQETIASLKEDISQFTQLADESNNSESKIKEENSKLQAENSLLKTKLNSVSTGFTMSEPMTKILFERPCKPSINDVYLAIKEIYPHVIFSDNIEKVVENCKFENKTKLFDYLTRICSEYFPQIVNGQPDTVAKECLGGPYSAGESDTSMSNPKIRASREFLFFGSKILIDKHVTLGSRHDKRYTCQVYFEVIEGTLYIAYIGEHLPLLKN